MTATLVILTPSRPIAPLTPAVGAEPGCLHIALALALVIFTLMGGFVAQSLGASAIACHSMALLSTVYALGLILFCEARLWFSPGVVRV